MKSIVFCFILFLLSLTKTFAQDLIITKTGKDIPGEVMHVTKTEIVYERADSVFTIPKSEIFMIKYANGSKALYGAKDFEKKEAIKAILTKNLSADSLKTVGEKDAKRYYRAYKGAATGTFISTLLFPPAGLTIAVATSSCRPSRYNLNYPSEALFAHPAYKNGYGETAHKKKQEQVWTNFGIGLVVSAALTFVIIPAVVNQF